MSLTYLEHVTTYFLSLVGKGVTLSSRDLALVQQWEERGLPAPTVCRALASAVAQRRRAGPLSISDCAETLERLTASTPRRPSRLEPASDPVWTPQALLDRLAQVGRAAATETEKEIYRELYRRVRSLPGAVLTMEDLDRLDEQAVELATAVLPVAEQRRIKAEARRRARHLLGPVASQAACDRLSASLTEGVIQQRLALHLPSQLLLREEGS
ncbi:MAG: hypothetical protein JW797_11785 [Bradymonadales bacterium]|nr:hypothetical protein [Bradymonadales bacterium]